MLVIGQLFQSLFVHSSPSGALGQAGSVSNKLPVSVSRMDVDCCTVR